MVIGKKNEILDFALLPYSLEIASSSRSHEGVGLVSSSTPGRGIQPTVLIIHLFLWDRVESRYWNLDNNFFAARPGKFGPVRDKTNLD